MSRQKKQTTNLTQKDVAKLLRLIRKRWVENDPLLIDLVEEIRKSKKKELNIHEIAKVIEDFVAKIIAEYFRNKL